MPPGDERVALNATGLSHYGQSILGCQDGRRTAQDRCPEAVPPVQERTPQARRADLLAQTARRDQRIDRAFTTLPESAPRDRVPPTPALPCSHDSLHTAEGPAAVATSVAACRSPGMQGDFAVKERSEGVSPGARASCPLEQPRAFGPLRTRCPHSRKKSSLRRGTLSSGRVGPPDHERLASLASFEGTSRQTTASASRKKQRQRLVERARRLRERHVPETRQNHQTRSGDESGHGPRHVRRIAGSSSPVMTSVGQAIPIRTLCDLGIALGEHAVYPREDARIVARDPPADQSDQFRRPRRGTRG